MKTVRTRFFTIHGRIEEYFFLRETVVRTAIWGTLSLILVCNKRHHLFFLSSQKDDGAQRLTKGTPWKPPNGCFAIKLKLASYDYWINVNNECRTNLLGRLDEYGVGSWFCRLSPGFKWQKKIPNMKKKKSQLRGYRFPTPY